MGEDIEVTDVNGNRVRVPLHPLLVALARAMRGRTPYATSTDSIGEWLHIDLQLDNDHHG